MTQSQGKRTGKDASIYPINVRETTWLYAERAHLVVCNQRPKENADIIHIPWKWIECALKIRPKPRQTRDRKGK